MRQYCHFKYCKLVREEKECAVELIGHQRVKANECVYGESDRKSKEQFINGNNDDMTAIIRANHDKKTNEATSDQVLCWAKRVDAQRGQKTMHDTSKESSGFDMVKKSKQN